MGPEKSSVGGRMRDLVLAVGGPLMPGEGVKGYLRRVARKAGISPWQARAAWYGEFREPEESVAYWKLRESAQREKSNKYKRVASVFDAAAQELAQADSDHDGRLRDLALRVARELFDLAEAER